MNWENPKRNKIIAILEQHEKKLISYSCRLTSNQELAKDIVQEAFLKLWKHQDFLNISSNALPWLYTVCRNLAIDQHRKGKKVILTDTNHDDSPDLSPTAEENLEQKQNTINLIAHIQKLNQKEQEIIHLKFKDNLSYKEIATITEQSVSNVGFVLHNAIKKMRKSMNQNALSQQGGES